MRQPVFQARCGRRHSAWRWFCRGSQCN